MLYFTFAIFKVVGETLEETRQLKLRTSCLMFDCCLVKRDEVHRTTGILSMKLELKPTQNELVCIASL